MLITFTTEFGNLVIRAEDLRRIEDERDGRCVVQWQPAGEGLHHQYITGTAAENQARIVAQEAAVIAAYEEAQRRERDRERFPVTRGDKVRVQR